MVDHPDAHNHNLVFRADDLLDTWHYRASAIGGCTKALLAARLGYPQAETVQPGSVMHKKMLEGHENEPHIVAAGVKELQRLGEISSTKLEKMGPVSIEVLPNIMVTGNLDGYVDGVVVEAKAFAQSTWDTWKAYELDGPGFFVKYKWQISCYMIATSSPAIFCVYNKDTGEYDFRYLDTPPVSLEDIRRKVESVELLVPGNVLPDDCDHPSFLCPFSHLHNKGEGKEVPSSGRDRFNEAASYFERARVKRESAQLEYEAAKAQLSTVMIDLGIDGNAQTEEWTVDWVENKGKKSISAKLIAKDLGISEKEVREKYSIQGKAFRYPRVRETL